MAHGGPDCRLGAYPGMGLPAQAASEPGIPHIGVHLLLGIEGLHAAPEDSDPPAEPCEGTQQRGGSAREGHAGGGRKSRDAEAGGASGSETGGRSSRAEPCGRSDHAVGSALGHRTQQRAAEWTELSNRTSAGRYRTHEGIDGIAASRNRCATGGRTRSRERPHPARSGSTERCRTTALVDGSVASTGKSGDGKCVRGCTAAVVGVARIAWGWTTRVDSGRRGRASATVDRTFRQSWCALGTGSCCGAAAPFDAGSRNWGRQRTRSFD